MDWREKNWGQVRGRGLEGEEWGASEGGGENVKLQT